MEVEEAAGLTMRRMQAAEDNCPERMDAADAEAPRIETAVEFWSGMGVETATRMQVEDTCPDAEGLTVRFFCCTRKKKRSKKN